MCSPPTRLPLAFEYRGRSSLIGCFGLPSRFKSLRVNSHRVGFRSCSFSTDNPIANHDRGSSIFPRESNEEPSNFQPYFFKMKMISD